MKSALALIAFLSLVLVACASAAVAPTPPQGSPDADAALTPRADASPSPGGTPDGGEPPPELQLALTVLGTPFTLADLAVLPQVQVAVDGQTYEGVSLLDLMAAAEMSDVVSVTLVSREAVTAEVTVADLNPDYILAFSADDLLDALLPGMGQARWLHDVVVVETSPGGQAALRVGEALLTWPAVRALEQVEVKAGTRTYSGVRLTDLLAAVGAGDVRTITLVGREGETLDLAVAGLSPDSILALGDEDRLDVVLPDVEKNLWPQDVFEIRLTP